MREERETVTVGTIGHVDHGKTRCTEAITKVLGSHKKYNEIDKAPEERRRGVTIKATHVRYKTERRNYTHIDCPGHTDYVKNMITGAWQMEGAILVVALGEGIMQQTKEHIRIAGAVGIKDIVVFINKEDEVEEEERGIMKEIVKEEVRRELEKNGYKKVKIVSGSAMEAVTGKNEEGIKELIRVMEEEIKTPEREKETSEWMIPIEEVHSITGRGTVITGKIIKGKIKRGEMIEIIPIKKKTVCIEIETFKKKIEYGECGESVGILLRGVTEKEIKRGMFGIKPGTRKGYKGAIVEIYIYKEEEGGRKKGFTEKYRPQMYWKVADKAIRMKFKGIIMPGTTREIEIEWEKELPIKKGERITIREGGKTIGAGIIKREKD